VTVIDCLNSSFWCNASNGHFGFMCPIFSFIFWCDASNGHFGFMCRILFLSSTLIFHRHTFMVVLVFERRACREKVFLSSTHILVSSKHVHGGSCFERRASREKDSSYRYVLVPILCGTLSDTLNLQGLASSFFLGRPSASAISISHQHQPSAISISHQPSAISHQHQPSASAISISRHLQRVISEEWESSGIRRCVLVEGM
jgi:hypothetical protein